MLQFIISLIVLGIIYSGAIRKEESGHVSRPQAVVPVIFGAVSVPVSFILTFTIAGAFVAAGITTASLHPALRSIVGAFVIAGFPEEMTKFAFMFLCILIFRARIRNVYEYILIGAGIGFGFSLLEEFMYGSGGIIALMRLLTIGAHMVFGILMARHIGTAAYNRAAGKPGAAKECLMAVAVPMLIHTLFDACTANNRLMQSESEVMQAAGILIAIAGMIILFALQMKVLLELKKDAKKYCNMEVGK